MTRQSISTCPLYSDAVIAELARRLHVLGNRARVQILYVVSRGEVEQQALADLVGIHPETASSHTEVLESAGLVTKRRQGHLRFLCATRSGCELLTQTLEGLRSKVAGQVRSLDFMENVPSVRKARS